MPCIPSGTCYNYLISQSHGYHSYLVHKPKKSSCLLQLSFSLGSPWVICRLWRSKSLLALLGSWRILNRCGFSSLLAVGVVQVTGDVVYHERSSFAYGWRLMSVKLLQVFTVHRWKGKCEAPPPSIYWPQVEKGATRLSSLLWWCFLHTKLVKLSLCA